jgi:TonB family protein
VSLTAETPADLTVLFRPITRYGTTRSINWTGPTSACSTRGYSENTWAKLVALRLRFHDPEGTFAYAWTFTYPERSRLMNSDPPPKVVSDGPTDPTLRLTAERQAAANVRLFPVKEPEVIEEIETKGDAWYQDSVVASLRSNWQRPLLEGYQEPLTVRVGFTIQRDGRVADAKIDASSGVPVLDRSVMRAVIDASPFPPLPQKFLSSSLPATFAFRIDEENGLAIEWAEAYRDTADSEPLLAGAANVSNPTLIPESAVAPTFPELAKVARLDGQVMLQAIVRKDGSVTDPAVIRSSRPNLGFEEAAIEAVRQWRYQPALQDGTPVDVYITIEVDFEMPGMKN